VFAPHVYTGVFTADAIAGQPMTLQQTGPDWNAAVADAKWLGLPLWVGEFGCGPADDRTILDPAYAQLDAQDVGGAMWIWRENHNDTNPAQTWSIEGTPREVTTARGYPAALGGKLVSLAENPLTHTFSMQVADAHGRTVVFLPPSEGGPMRLTGARARVEPFGAGRVVQLTPTAATFTLSVG
jgi:hypothetical protein